MGNGLRVLVAERKSRAGDNKEDARYRRQENKNIRTAESNGNVIISKVADTVSSQTLPWKRKNLKQWFTNPAMIGMWDAVLISEVSRISRGDSDTWFEIEQWCRANGKYIMDGDGLIWPNADDEKWDEKRRAARDYWESVRDSHAEVRADIVNAKAAIGRPPFGYTTADREDGYKKFVIDDVTGPLAKESFVRISQGHTATSVALWLSEVTGKVWRVKRVTDMIARRTYLGERDGHTFEALVTEELFDSANAAMATRSFVRKETGGRRTDHGYSGLVFCECGAQYYHHQSTKEGKNVGQAKYRCGRGRRGDVTETKCSFGAPVCGVANDAVDYFMTHGMRSIKETVLVTTGGDHGKQMELDRINKEMSSAMAKKDMAAVAKLAAEYSEVDARETEPVKVTRQETGNSYADLWETGNLADRRSILERLGTMMKLTVVNDHGEWKVNAVPMMDVIVDGIHTL